MILPRPQEEWLGEAIPLENIPSFSVCGEGVRPILLTLEHLLPQLQLAEGEGARFVLAIRPELSAHAEYYEIESCAEHVCVSAVDYAGLVHGVATLSALLSCRDGGCSIREARIRDWPDTSFRSYMLDPARGRIPMDEIRAVIVGMARAKMNKLHLHLSDHEGYAYRSRAIPGLPQISSGGYTREELEEIVSLCGIFGIDVIPEIDVPAHSSALVGWMPRLGCQSNNGSDFSPWNLCLGNEESYLLISRLLGELAEIFPYEYIHVGTDEIHMGDIPTHPDRPISHCMDCTACNSFFAPMGYDTLQKRFYYFVRRVHAILRSLGKRMMIWNDNIDISTTPDIPRDVFIEFWRVAAEGRGPVEGCSMQGFLNAGFDLINADFPNTYLEEYVSFEKLCDWNPLCEPAADVDGHIRGLEACLWGGGSLPQYSYVAFFALPLYGDRAWNCTKPIPRGKETALALTRAVLGAEAPYDFDLFSYFSEVPLSNACLSENEIFAKNADLSALREKLSALSLANRDAAHLVRVLHSLIDNSMN